MTDLPKWIEEAEDDLPGVTHKDAERLLKALRIAWDAMETIIANPVAACSDRHDVVTQDAMRCIEEVGEMTRNAEEVAKECLMISIDVDNLELNEHGKSNMEKIAEIITAYADERVKEAINKIDPDFDESYNQGYLKGIEDAAKIVETCIKPEECKDCAHDPRWCPTRDSREDAALFVAFKIRALGAKKP